jgi:transcriptional regulator with XRE-family HTH domain
MPSSPSSRVQAARRELAARLRDIRLDAGLTGRDLAARCGWSPSKASRIENAVTPPSQADIRAWCRACATEEQAPDLVAAARSADSMYVEWRRLQRTGLRRLQESRVPLYEKTRLFRVYCSNVVPGLLQTGPYAAALLSSIATFHETPDDIEQAVKARIDRTRILREGDHRFALVIEESVLRHRVADAMVMAGQLGHLLSVMSLPAVSLGVIPFAAGPRDMWPLEAFNVFDDERVHVELLTAAVTVTAPSEIAQYVTAFGHLADLAVYGTSARSLITTAIDSLG